MTLPRGYAEKIRGGKGVRLYWGRVQTLTESKEMKSRSKREQGEWQRDVRQDMNGKGKGSGQSGQG